MVDATVWICLSLVAGIILITVGVYFLYPSQEDFHSPYRPLAIFKNTGYVAPGPAFFRRPFMRRPLYLRPSLYPLLQDVPAYPELPTGNCKVIPKLDQGTMRIPAFVMDSLLHLRSQLDTLKSNSWSIAFWARLHTDQIPTTFTMLKKGYYGPSSPQMDYVPDQKLIVLTVNSVFDQITSHPVDVSTTDLKTWNYFVWSQRGGRMTFYVNGVRFLDQRIDSAPSPIIISRGPLWIRSNNLVEYKNILLCNRPWDAETVISMMNQQRGDTI